MDHAMRELDLLFERFSETTPIISDEYLRKCAKYFDLEAMYRPPRRPVPGNGKCGSPPG